MSTDNPPTRYRHAGRETVTMILWGLGWVAGVALARFGPALWGAQHPIASAAAIVVSVGIGIGWILAFRRMLRALDDLDRKIMLDALGITVGVTLIVSVAYAAALHAALISPVDIAVLPAGLGVVFVASFLLGKIRYR